MDAQDPEKVSAIWVKNLNSIINKMKNTQSSMNHMSPEDAVKLDIVELNKPNQNEKPFYLLNFTLFLLTPLGLDREGRF